MAERVRCGWVTSELMIAYHDEEWGRPVHDDVRLLTKRGFRFVGPTVCYGFMQAVGMVTDCHCRTRCP